MSQRKELWKDTKMAWLPFAPHVARASSFAAPQFYPVLGDDSHQHRSYVCMLLFSHIRRRFRQYLLFPLVHTFAFILHAMLSQCRRAPVAAHSDQPLTASLFHSPRRICRSIASAFARARSPYDNAEYNVKATGCKNYVEYHTRLDVVKRCGYRNSLHDRLRGLDAPPRHRR